MQKTHDVPKCEHDVTLLLTDNMHVVYCKLILRIYFLVTEEIKMVTKTMFYGH